MDKRRYSRLVARVEIVIKKISAGEINDPWAVVSKDISAGGVGIVSERELKVSDVLFLDIKLPDGRQLHTAGEVKWIMQRENLYSPTQRDFSAGIEFIKITDENKKVIDDFISQAKFSDEN